MSEADHSEFLKITIKNDALKETTPTPSSEVHL